jgi:hypothetical protein
MWMWMIITITIRGKVEGLDKNFFFVVGWVGGIIYMLFGWGIYMLLVSGISRAMQHIHLAHIH